VQDIAAEFSAIIYLSTCKVDSFSSQETQAQSVDKMASFSETKVLKYAKSASLIRDWALHNSRRLSRIYPKGSRVDSSNYSPIAAWGAGCQMVALNTQTHDDNYHINYGKFRDNGRSGYVLKPPYLLGQPSAVKASHPKVLSVHVLSGSQIPRPSGTAHSMDVVDPLVSVTISGAEVDCREQRTKTVNDNGFNPVWNEILTFKITDPDAAIITFNVLDEDFGGAVSFIAFCSLPLSTARCGIRMVPLYDAKGLKFGDHEFASLLVRIDIA